MQKGTSQLVFLGIANIAIALIGLCYFKFVLMAGTVLAMTAIAIAFTTYFGFVAISQSQDKGWAANIGSMRTAIASGILVLYLFILPISIFLKQDVDMSGFGQTMVNNFTTTISIIIPFYFGASVYAQVHGSSRDKEDDKGNIPNNAQ